jgi:hypothetical protein
MSFNYVCILCTCASIRVKDVKRSCMRSATTVALAQTLLLLPALLISHLGPRSIMVYSSARRAAEFTVALVFSILLFKA